MIRSWLGVLPVMPGVASALPLDSPPIGRRHIFGRVFLENLAKQKFCLADSFDKRMFGRAREGIPTRRALPNKNFVWQPVPSFFDVSRVRSCDPVHRVGCEIHCFLGSGTQSRQTKFVFGRARRVGMPSRALPNILLSQGSAKQNFCLARFSKS